MTLTLHKRIAFIFRFCTFLSLLLMAVATLEMFVVGSVNKITEISPAFIVSGIVTGDFMSTYFAAIVVLIFSPMINLLAMAVTFLQDKQIRFSITAVAILMIMIIAMLLKV